MYKIREVTFANHPVLGNLYLNFCDSNGKAVDTVIFAGENGNGKSTILNELYRVASHTVNCEMKVSFENNGTLFYIKYYLRESYNANSLWYADDGQGMNVYIDSEDIKNRYQFHGIYSDVDINFHSNQLSSVTSLSLDDKQESRKSSNNLPQEINQLLIDIQAQDDSAVNRAVQEHPDVLCKDLVLERKIPRFTSAFNRMLECLSYSHVENRNNYKAIIFMKYGREIPIDVLSSGEKQIVYRGCFLLKDVNAINGAFVFIDEPEISLHPNWQSKIMDYYTGIFTDTFGKQTSQIFSVTHSPFVIHNENRKNDKVIVLTRNQSGEICVSDKPEYFKCTSVEAVKDAFFIRNFVPENSSVYLEGRTDEKYFRKAVNVFGYNHLPFEFHWVGYMKDEKNEENTGKDALNKAAQFLIGRNLAQKQVCLFDCDTRRMETVKNNIYTKVIPFYNNSKRMKIGIENALVLDEIDTDSFYSTKVKEGDYGDDNIIKNFEKMKFCDYVCSLDDEILRSVFANLKTVIDSLRDIFKE